MLSHSVIIWIAIAVVLGIIEAFTVALVSIWLAIGAVFASVAAFFGINAIGQLMVFSVVSLVLLISTRPFVKKFLSTKIEHTNADRIVGQTATVTEEINNIENCGKVKVSGEIWTARSIDNTKIETGTLVHIERIEGVKAIVSSLNQGD